MSNDVQCPGCGLSMPQRKGLTAKTYYNTTPECWSVYTEVLATEYSNAVIFGQVHQLTVDTYAVQHAGGPHPDKSLTIHLAGLHLVLERGILPPHVPPLLQRLATRIPAWPHFVQPEVAWPITIFDVATASSPAEHAAIVREWAHSVWSAWSAQHGAVAELLDVQR